MTLERSQGTRIWHRLPAGLRGRRHWRRVTEPGLGPVFLLGLRNLVCDDFGHHSRLELCRDGGGLPGLDGRAVLRQAMHI